MSRAFPTETQTPGVHSAVRHISIVEPVRRKIDPTLYVQYFSSHGHRTDTREPHWGPGDHAGDIVDMDSFMDTIWTGRDMDMDTWTGDQGCTTAALYTLHRANSTCLPPAAGPEVPVGVGTGLGDQQVLPVHPNGQLAAVL